MIETYDEAVAEFTQMSPSVGESVLREYYDRELFARSRARLRAAAKAQVDVLILTAGGQHYSPTLSLELSPAKMVVFLCTEESLASADRAAQLVLGADVVRRIEMVEKASATSVYTAVLRSYETCRSRVEPGARPLEVAVDITSGTKAMTAALSSAAMVIAAAQRYVEGTPSVHRGYVVREQPHEIEHPLKAMGDLQRREAERLFDNLALEHAEALFRDLDRRGAPGYRYRERALLAQAYQEVDRLRFDEAAKLLGEALPRLGSRLGTTDPLCEEAPRLERQRAVLEELAQPGKARTEIFLRFLVAYADRRAKQGLLDAAALVHYRTIELAIQHRLGVHGVEAENATPEAYDTAARARGLDAAGLLSAFNRLAGGEYKQAELPAKLALAQGWTMLGALGDPLAAGDLTRKVLGQTKARNASIFAHGYKPLAAKDFEAFRATAAEVRGRLAELERWSLPAPDPDMEHVRLGGRA